MALFTRVIRTRTGSSGVRTSNELKAQFLRELTDEGTQLMKQLQQQFTQDLQSQAASVLNNSANGAPNSGDATRLLTTATRYLFSRPITTEDSANSDRSNTTQTQFRLSQAQALAEANQTISKGDKNL